MACSCIQADEVSEPNLPVSIVGVTVTPLARAAGMKYSRETDGELGARVELFVRNTAKLGSGDEGLFSAHAVTFDGMDPQRLIRDEDWAWHDTPSIWSQEELAMPAGSLAVWKFNSKSTRWGVGKTFKVRITDWDRARAVEIPVRLDPPRLWLSAVTFLSSDGNVVPDTLVFHVENQSGSAVRVTGARLFLPRSSSKWRLLFPQPPLSNLAMFPTSGVISNGEKGGAQVRTGRLPLTYAALEVDLADAGGKAITLWAHQRIKRECFDISGGWVQGGGPVNPLTCLPYLKTLMRMHINTANIASVPGYTDQTGPEGLSTRYPLKRFGPLEPVSAYDTDAMLPFIHGVELFEAPQYGVNDGVKLPRSVWQALLPFAQTRLSTTLNLDDESNWRDYAGLSDYPDFDACRVCVPAADNWERYDRWGDQRIGWGGPLETIGSLCRCLRELSRPVPIACWVQGPHTGGVELDGRERLAPTPDEMRLQAYHALSSRVTSIYWFNLSPPALVQYRDTLDEVTRVGREVRMLEPFYLEGDAYLYRQTRSNGQLDWDLASIVSPIGALLFALDLDYAPSRSKVFEFKRPRAAQFNFDLPAYLQHPADVFRVDADGVYDVQYAMSGQGIAITDKQSKVAIYVVSPNTELRSQIERKRQKLVEFESSFDFDPAHRHKDYVQLKDILEKKSE
ncbi:MAG: hypothetical protein M1608_10615 [Candidatus Omnitrophica bacterium]|nr:hypothetical protein [Candidatus Omnitrophota bacterium]